MTEIINDDELFGIVSDAVVLALAAEPDQIRPDTKLLEDLGAESIDFLDITFRLEQMLPIRIPRDDLIEQFEEVLGEETVVDADRRLTPLGAYLIRERLAGIDSERVQPGLPVDEIVKLWTVQTWVEIAKRLLETLPEKCPECGGDPVAVKEDGRFHQVRCASCQAVISTTPGDTLNQQWLETERDKPEVKELLANDRQSESAAVGFDADA
jgi:acyl carrier protein